MIILTVFLLAFPSKFSRIGRWLDDACCVSIPRQKVSIWDSSARGWEGEWKQIDIPRTGSANQWDPNSVVESRRGRHVMLISDLQMCILMHTLCMHIYDIKINRTKEMAQWIRYFLWKYGEENSDSQNPHKSKGGIAAAYNSSIWEAETQTPYRWISWLARLVGIGGLGVYQEASESISKMESDQGRNKFQVYTPTYTEVHAYIPTHTCMHITHNHTYAYAKLKIINKRGTDTYIQLQSSWE